MIDSFHIIILIASRTRDTGWSAMSLGQTLEFLCVFCRQAKPIAQWWILIREWTSCLAISFFSWFCGVDNLEEFHKDTVSHWELDLMYFLYLLNSAHTQCEHFCIIFFNFSCIQPKFILDYWSNGEFWDSLWSSFLLHAQSSESVSKFTRLSQSSG